ncbi:MAG: hypothetical protein ACKOE8_16575 [Opitutaceae bacterium]
MKLNLLPLALGVATLLFAAACSTPASRIKANPEAFARLTADQKGLVQAGQIALGFEPEAVRLALGDPDRTTVRTDARGETIVWHFLSYEAEGRVLFTGHYHSGRNGWRWGAAYPYYLDYPARTVRDRFRVEFQGGKVVAITRADTR